MKECSYGCGQEANFTLKNGKFCCSKHFNSCPSIRAKNSKGVKQAHKEGRMYKFTVDDVFKSNQKAKENSFKKAFIKDSTYSTSFIKAKFIEKRNYECNICGISEWNNSPIVLELNHINGDNRDNRWENLRLLCPNCHSQTGTFRGRNINSGHKKSIGQ